MTEKEDKRSFDIFGGFFEGKRGPRKVPKTVYDDSNFTWNIHRTNTFQPTFMQNKNNLEEHGAGLRTDERPIENIGSDEKLKSVPETPADGCETRDSPERSGDSPKTPNSSGDSPKLPNSSGDSLKPPNSSGDSPEPTESELLKQTLLEITDPRKSHKNRRKKGKSPTIPSTVT